ncbi:MAG: leucine--tRNA ligase [Candidatus Paceibacterota bacterium]|jgi:leucyl-tRNA synthetase
MAYDHTDIEKKAQEKWASLDLYKSDLSDESKEPYYLLVEFPYPSGDLHIGHWYAFAVTDIYARMLRARGKNVLFPIGFDAFGLPAENAAIKHGVDPKEWTYKNIERMREQLASMGPSFDWSKEVLTCDPGYYQWTQWLFAKLFEHDLAEHKSAAVKWCPKDQTVLANEQVVDGRCERCGTEVEEKKLTQWFLKITDYAERLLEGLEKLPWRNEIKDAQRAWIGKSDGAYLEFQIVGREEKIKVFTTRPDTVFGATYVVLAPEHALVSSLLDGVSNKKEIEEYVRTTAQKTERERSENKEKTGVKLEGVSAINPATKEEIPVYVADYVLASYGTGAVMAVPAHDERDFEFAQKFDLPIQEVVSAEGMQIPYTGIGTLTNSSEFTGKNSEEAKWDIVKYAGGEKATQYRIRDWLVSRQRYWGCPIPIVYDPEGKPHAIPAEHLPWLLPTDVDFTPTGKAPLASSQELQERVVRIFGEGWTPEYDTLDTFIDSSWYFLRYLDPKDSHDFSDVALMKKWLPVNRYSGGSEHTTMHLLYARFFMKALYDLALVPVEEPFTERFNRGLVMGPDGQKMSKSKGNVVNPDEFVQKYGADAVRVFLAFIGPYNEPGSYPWSLDGVASMRKFLERVARMVGIVQGAQGILRTLGKEINHKPIDPLIAATVKKVAEDGDRFKFNTGVAALMSLLNEMEISSQVSLSNVRDFVIMLAPFAPHLVEHLWEQLGGEGSVHQQSWPIFDPSLLISSTVNVTVQVNGKRRGSIILPADAPEDSAIAEALKIPVVTASFTGKEPKRVVYVPNKIINLVV